VTADVDLAGEGAEVAASVDLVGEGVEEVAAVVDLVVVGVKEVVSEGVEEVATRGGDARRRGWVERVGDDGRDRRRRCRGKARVWGGQEQAQMRGCGAGNGARVGEGVAASFICQLHRARWAMGTCQPNGPRWFKRFVPRLSRHCELKSAPSTSSMLCSGRIEPVTIVLDPCSCQVKN
jgi:hypothetical protein